MSSMGYCKWQNLLNDLREIALRLDDELSQKEKIAQAEALIWMKQIIEELT